MPDETVITFAKDDTIIVDGDVASVAAKLQVGGWVRLERGAEAVHVAAGMVRYVRAVKRAEGGR